MDPFWTPESSSERACGRGYQAKLFQSEVEYLEHKISKDGVEMIPDYVHKVTTWPVPMNGKEMVPRICRILQILHSSVFSIN